MSPATVAPFGAPTIGSAVTWTIGAKMNLQDWIASVNSRLAKFRGQRLGGANRATVFANEIIRETKALTELIVGKAPSSLSEFSTLLEIRNAEAATGLWPKVVTDLASIKLLDGPKLTQSKPAKAVRKLLAKNPNLTANQLTETVDELSAASARKYTQEYFEAYPEKRPSSRPKKSKPRKM